MSTILRGELKWDGDVLTFNGKPITKEELLRMLADERAKQKEASRTRT